MASGPSIRPVPELMKKNLIRIGALLVVLVVVGVVLAAMFLGSIIKKGVETAGPAMTGTPVTLGGANLSLFSGTGSLKEFVLGNPPGYKGEFAMRVTEAEVGIEPGSLFADKIHVTRIKIAGPEIRLEGDPRKNNFSTILDHVKSVVGNGGINQPAGPVEPTGPRKKLQLDEFSLTGAKVHLQSDLIGPKPIEFTLPDIQVTGLGQGPDGITGAELAGRLLNEITQYLATSGARQLAEQAAAGALKSATNRIGQLGDELQKKATDKLGQGLGDLLKKK